MPCDQCTDPARCNRFGVCQQFRHILPSGGYLRGYGDALDHAPAPPTFDNYTRLTAPDGTHIEHCPVCAADPEVWQYIAKEGEVAQKVVMCSHNDEIGPHDALAGGGCPLYMPPQSFYRPTIREAVKHWNEYAKALSALRRQNACKHAQVLRGDTAGVTVAPAPAGKPPEDSYPDQTILHAEGECGNCLQATIAGVLGWPLAAVPHFALLGEDHWWDCAQAWLNSQGYWIDYQPTSYAAEGGELMPRCWLSGRSPRGFSHAVVGDSATLQVLHDPHPSRAGLVEHSYTIYFFRKPTAGVTAAPVQTFPHEPPMKDSP